jgi:hypothetical protein
MPWRRSEEVDLFTYIEIHCVRDRIGVEVTELC